MVDPEIEEKFRNSMQQYGKQEFSQLEQINILNLILEDAKNKLSKDDAIYQLISKHQSRLKAQEDLEQAIKTVNTLVVKLEAKDKNKTTVNYLKKQGLYRILYHNPLLLGEKLASNDSLNKLLRNGFIGIGISALAIVFFALTVFFSAPFWLTAIATGLFVGASAYLSGILYGVVNDLFATHSNLPYFLLGHQPQQKSLLRTNNKIAQGIAWGVAATFGPVLIAAIVFTVAALITAFFVPMATFILPVIMIAMPLIAVGAEIYARKKTQQFLQLRRGFPWSILNTYQSKGVRYMSPTKSERAAWYTNSDRNMFGFYKVPFIGLAILVVLIVLSAVSMFLPPLLFVSPIIAMAIPIAFAATVCSALIAGGVYMYANRNKQEDNRYRLDFDNEDITPNLYLDEDMDYVDALVKSNKASEPAFFDRPRTPESSETDLTSNSEFTPTHV